MINKGIIYALLDPRTNEIRYIGQTISKLNTRYKAHCTDFKRRITKNNSWIKSLYNLNLKPNIEIIEENIDISILDNKEIEYISLYKSYGMNLNNHTIGGKGTKGYIPTSTQKINRINSLKNSDELLLKNKKHSEFMKERHKLGLITPPVLLMPKEKRIQKGLIHSLKLQKPIDSYDQLGNKLISFKNANEAITYYKISRYRFYKLLNNSFKGKSDITFKYKITDK